MKTQLSIVTILFSLSLAFSQGCPDQPWKKLFGSSAFLYLEYNTCAEKNRLSESGSIAKCYLRAIDHEDTAVCNVTITYNTKGKPRSMTRKGVVFAPGGVEQFLVEADGIEALSVDVATVRFHSKP